jgi:murein DD-endopeptidase MepM/ murein hydrolase activator NlpD
MSPEGSRRRRAGKQFEVLIVPRGNDGKTRGFKTTKTRVWLLVGAVVFAIVGLTLLALMYTPLAMYVTIPNPGLERRYGQQIVETQQRLNELAENVLVLKEYNLRLRKVLGEQSRDTSRMTGGGVQVQGRPRQPLGVLDTAITEQPDPGVSEEDGGDIDVQSANYNAVVTSPEGFRGAFPLLAPSQGYVSQGFDPARQHYGVDFAGKRGTAVHAATDGYVMFSGWTYEDGNMIMLSHGGGYVTVYKHNQSLMKTPQTFVKRGEIIALLGSSGKTSSGPHVHFELWKDGVPLDPAEYLLNAPRIQ